MKMGKTAAMPSDMRHAALKCFWVVARTTIMGTKVPATKPRSNWKLVAKMNHLLRVPDSNTDEHTVCGQGGDHAVQGSVCTVGTGRQGGEDDHDAGGDHQGVLSGPVITKETEEDLTNDSTDKGEGSDVSTGVGLGESSAIDGTEDGVDGSNDL
jgi:hypothetical protein